MPYMSTELTSFLGHHHLIQSSSVISLSLKFMTSSSVLLLYKHTHNLLSPFSVVHKCVCVCVSV